MKRATWCWPRRRAARISAGNLVALQGALVGLWFWRQGHAGSADQVSLAFAVAQGRAEASELTPGGAWRYAAFGNVSPAGRAFDGRYWQLTPKGQQCLYCVADACGVSCRRRVFLAVDREDVGDGYLACVSWTTAAGLARDVFGEHPFSRCAIVCAR